MGGRETSGSVKDAGSNVNDKRRKSIPCTPGVESSVYLGQCLILRKETHLFLDVSTPNAGKCRLLSLGAQLPAAPQPQVCASGFIPATAGLGSPALQPHPRFLLGVL